MFDWIGDALSWITDSMSDAGKMMSSVVWDILLIWIYEAIYGAIADFFGMINSMGLDIFNMSWVTAFLKLFALFGWALFAAGLVVAVFDLAVEYQSGRSNIQGTCLNILKGFIAAGTFYKVPIFLYKFCVTLQMQFSDDLIVAYIGAHRGSLVESGQAVLSTLITCSGLLGLLTLTAFGYCVVKLFFANIKRGGILLCQIAVGSLYMFSIPRGFSDGFNGWCKQIFALCLTTFMQTSLLFLGLLTWQSSMLLGLGIMLSANEVPKIAQQFGLDTSVRVNMMSVTSTVNTAVRAGKFVAGKLS